MYLPPEITLSIVAIMLVFSALFSAAETAILSVSKARLHHLARQPDARRSRRALAALSLLKTPDQILATIVLANNAINIVSSTLTTAVMVQLVGPVGVAYATAVMAGAIIILCEALPKAIGAQYPLPLTLWFTAPLKALMLTFTPLLWLIRNFNRGILKMVGLNNHEGARFTDADLRGAVNLALENHIISADHSHMLTAVLDLDDLTVADVMIHRSAINMLDIKTTPDQLPAVLATTPRSRIPVYEGTPDHLLGILNVRDYLAALAQNKHSIAVPLRPYLRPLTFIPETTPLGHQLREFLRNHQQQALVVDEYGDIQGLLSLEDILEEIVGDISDEHDPRKESENNPAPDGSVTLPGRTPVRDANRRFGWHLPDDIAVTLSGLVTEALGHLPLQGEGITLGNLTLTVAAKRGHRIERIKITPPAV